MLGNGAKETTTTSGTGTVTLSAVTGSPRFADVFSTGVIVPYAINDGNNWEWGYGTVSASNTLARSVILATYVSGTFSRSAPSAITLSGGSSSVYCALLQESVQENMPALSSAAGVKGIHGGPIGVAVSGTIAITANRLYIVPISLQGYAGVCTGFRLWVNSAGAASTTIRLGLYQIGTDGYPGKLLVSTSTQAVDATGYFSVAASANTWISSGNYFLGIVSDGAPTIAANGAAASINSLGINSGSGGSAISGLYKAYTYAALPDPAGASGWTVVATTSNPTVGLTFS
jgi:hypothetical protein